MSDKKISEVPHDDAVGGSEKIPVADGTASKYVTVDDIKNHTTVGIRDSAETQTPDASTDSVIMRDSSSLKRTGLGTLFRKAFDWMFTQTETSSVAQNDQVSIKANADGEPKRTTVANLANAVKTAIGGSLFKIEDLPDFTGAAASSSKIAICENQSGAATASTSKVSLASIIAMFFQSMFSSAASGASVTNDDYFYIGKKTVTDGVTTYPLTKVPKSGIALGGDVTGPNASGNGNVATYSGTSGKILANGPSVTGSVASTSTSGEIPTALAVWNAVTPKVTGPNSATNHAIPVFSGTTGKALYDSQHLLSTGQTLSSNDTYYDVPTCKQVYDTFKNSVQCSSASVVDEQLPAFDGTGGKTIKAGKVVVTALTDLASDAQIPTALAVRSGTVRPGTVSGITGNEIPLFEGTDGKVLKNSGKKIVTQFPDSNEDNAVPTCGAVVRSVANVVRGPATHQPGRIARFNGTASSLTVEDSGYTINDQALASGSVPTGSVVQSAISGAITDLKLRDFNGYGLLANFISEGIDTGAVPSGSYGIYFEIVNGTPRLCVIMGNTKWYVGLTQVQEPEEE